MTRITRAARTLTQQIWERWPDANVTAHGDPDGLDVVRGLAVDGEVAEPLFTLLVPIADHDRRISQLRLSDDGDVLVIEFASDRHADETTPFPLAEVAAVQQEDDVNGGQGDDEPSGGESDPASTAEKAAARKAPAKKAAAKKDEA